MDLLTYLLTTCDMMWAMKDASEMTLTSFSFALSLVIDSVAVMTLVWFIGWFLKDHIKWILGKLWNCVLTFDLAANWFNWLNQIINWLFDMTLFSISRISSSPTSSNDLIFITVWPSYCPGLACHSCTHNQLMDLHDSVNPIILLPSHVLRL